MAQFDVHRNTGSSRTAFPYLVVLQSSLLSVSDRWVVIPLVPNDAMPQHDRRLTPDFVIDGRTYLLATQGITNVPRDRLGAVVASLFDDAERIIDAVDWMMNRGWR